MTDQKKQNDAQQAREEEVQTEEIQAEEASTGTAAEETQAGDAATQGEDKVDPIAVLRDEVSNLKDQLLRALAELENTRRRAQKDKQDAARYAPAPLARDLLAVSDNLSRALDSVPEDLASDARVKNLIDGLEMTRRELQGVFEKHDIARIEPLGEKLDPHRHEAMFEVEDPSQAPGTVIQVIEPGYVLHDRLLRPARVGVAKGGAKAETQSEETQAPANDDGGEAAKD
ncbi:MAG: nucleotide exchange factor GrpE [Rhodovibrionaceae bacterium]